MRALFGRLVPVILRHFDAYAEIAGEDARDAAAHVARRLLALFIAAACIFVALLMSCAWLLVLVWDTPWRAWTAGGLALLFAAGAAVLAWLALKGGAEPGTQFFARVRGEFNRDRELIERAFDGKQGEGNGHEHRAD